MWNLSFYYSIPLNLLLCWLSDNFVFSNFLLKRVNFQHKLISPLKCDGAVFRNSDLWSFLWTPAALRIQASKTPTWAKTHQGFTDSADTHGFHHYTAVLRLCMKYWGFGSSQILSVLAPQVDLSHHFIQLNTNAASNHLNVEKVLQNCKYNWPIAKTCPP